MKDEHKTKKQLIVELMTLRKLVAGLSKLKTKEEQQNAVKKGSGADKYRTLLEQIPVLTYVAKVDDLNITIFVSPQIEKLTGYSQADVIANPSYLWQKIIHPEDQNRVREKANSSQASNKPFVAEYRVFHRDGSLKWLHDEAVVVRDENGNPILWSGVVLDITKRKQADEALRESEERFRQLAENINEVFWMTSPDKLEMLYVSPGYEKIWGRSCTSLYERPTSFLEAIHPEDKERVAARQAEQIQGTYEEKFRITRPDGAVRWIRDRAFPIIDENKRVYRIAGIAEDITDRVRVEEEILRYQEQLRSMASELSLAEERERRLIAVQLHDGVGQTLALTKIKLGNLRALLADTDFSRPIEDVRLLMEQTVKSVRSLTFEISPPILYELGLVDALESLVEKFQEDQGILSKFSDDREPKPLKDDIKVVVFQAARELLVNVAKHSQAKKIEMATRRIEDTLEINIEDDGVGFDSPKLGQSLSRNRGFGLFSIRERLSHLGGSLEIRTQQGCGTCVTIRAPLKAEE